MSEIRLDVSGSIGQRTPEGIQSRTTKGAGNTFRALAQRVEAPEEPEQFLRCLAQDFGENQKDVFAREGAIAGYKRWQALKPETERRKGSSRILVQSGRLRASLVDPSHPNFWAVLRSKSVQIGTSVEYAQFVNKRRSLIRVTKETIGRWTKAFGEFMANRSHK